MTTPLYKPFSLKVVDGDTLDCILRLEPFTENLVERRLRLYGIDTPEKNTPAGQAVRLWVEEWVIIHYDLLRVRYVEDDKFSGRFVGRLVLHGSTYNQPEQIKTTDEVDLSNVLLRNYMAKSFTGKVAKSPWTPQELDIAKAAAGHLPVRNPNYRVPVKPAELEPEWITDTTNELIQAVHYEQSVTTLFDIEPTPIDVVRKTL